MDSLKRKHQHTYFKRGTCIEISGSPTKKNFFFLGGGDCVQASCHLINRTPSVVLDYKTASECFFGKPPTMADIRILGCLCYAYHISHGGDKFSSRSRRCIYVGYSYTRKDGNYTTYKPKNYFVSRDIKFLENKFPFTVSEPVKELVVE